jgi:hypothetical protein
MSLAKTSTTESVITAGQVVPYKYVIRNTGQIILHNIALADDNIDAPPVCLFIGRNELALAPDPASFVACSAQHTVTQLEIEVEGNLDNTASATSEETEVVITSLSIPIRIFSDGFEAAKNIITVLDDPESEVGEQNSIAIGADGFPVISYHDRTTGSLKVAKCNDVACTGKDETISTVDDPDNSVGWYNSLVIGSDGFPVISYHDETAGTLKVAKCNDVACTGSDETITTVDGLVNDVGDYTSIAIGTDTFPVISYYARGLGALKVVKCNDTACSGSNEIITTVDGLASNVGLWNSLAISTDGFPVIGYNHFFPARSLKVVKCNDAACAGGDETISTVDGLDSDVGQFISLAISTDGFPVISYQDFSLARALKVAKCNDAACTGSDETITTVDGLVNDVGAWTSLAIGSDGSPVISYFDSTAGALKVAKCNDPSCSGGDETISTVDNPANQVGLLSSIVIGVDGLPVISYLDNTTKELKVMHCGRPDCS